MQSVKCVVLEERKWKANIANFTLQKYWFLLAGKTIWSEINYKKNNSLDGQNVLLPSLTVILLSKIF